MKPIQNRNVFILDSSCGAIDGINKRVEQTASKCIRTIYLSEVNFAVAHVQLVAFEPVSLRPGLLL